VVDELVGIRKAINKEASAISEIHHNLMRIGKDESSSTRKLLSDYTESVINDEWAPMAHDKLSDRTDKLLRSVEGALLEMEPNTPRRQILLPHIFSDMDKVSDYRLSRLQHAQSRPPYVLYAVLLGYLATMACFGVYRPRPALVGLISRYTTFVGIVIYLVLAMSQPFQGVTPLDPHALEFVLDMMRAQLG
jgi:hypothetical protein